ncbi:MAG: class E sortase [Actinomycetota bacterium]
MSDPKTPGRSSGRTTDKKDAKPKKPLPAWRQRLYRIPVLGTIAYVVWPPRTSASIVRRSFSGALAIVAILGIGMAAYPWAGESYPFFYRIPVEKLIEWSNFLSDMQTNRLQDQLAKEFAGLDELGLGEGDPLTLIEIPALGVKTIVVQGTSPSALRAGAGHYPSTPLPGSNGNVAIAGHRTTFGRPFNKVDQLEVGDRIFLTTPVARYSYRVSRDPWITSPFDWAAVGKTDKASLTLTTCHPKGSARQRLIVRAELYRSQARQNQAA